MNYYNDAMSPAKRRLLCHIYEYMSYEADSDVESQVNENVLTRVSAATGVPLDQIIRVLSERHKPSDLQTYFSYCNKRTSFPINLTKDHIHKIQEMITRAYKTHTRLPTLVRLMEELTSGTQAIQFKGSIECLRKVVEKLGYRIYNDRILVERIKLRSKRIKYVKTLSKLRYEKKTVFYINTEEFISFQDDAYYKVVAAFAGSWNGFVSPVFVTTVTDDVSLGEKYCDWLVSKILPLLPENAILAMDRSDYFEKVLAAAPHCFTEKTSMVNWLNNHNIHCNPELLKPEIYKIVKQHKSQYLELHYGVPVVLIPQYYSKLNLAWFVWNKLSWKAPPITNNIDHLKDQLQKKLSAVHLSTWFLAGKTTIANEQTASLCEELHETNVDSYEMTIYSDSAGSNTDSEVSDG